jgi:hypothetical protein
MNKNAIVQTAALIAGAAVVGASVAQSIKTHRIERARRDEIERNLQFDLTAIRNAGEVIRQRMATEGFVPAYVRMEQLDAEIDFQKIVVREQ